MNLKTKLSLLVCASMVFVALSIKDWFAAASAACWLVTEWRLHLVTGASERQP